ncbi:MAG TPA: M15 family metallopeptidase [Candidatus Limnocylindria bacterium]|nr:M15 family metallopeptidase [Candidatus Limnocylindria bacterium]
MAALLLALLAVSFYATAEAVWDYPLPANLLKNRDRTLTLVNRDSKLEADYTPASLVPLNLRAVSGPHELRKPAADALRELFLAAEGDGHTLYVKSSYRSYGTQATMYENRKAREGKDDGVVAAPGTSDHQTGLGVDVLNRYWAERDGMTPKFGETPEARWLEANCARFGFIIRYLPEKKDITGIIYEPWHLRYVGREAAAYIMENRLSLEEFDQEWHAAIGAFEERGGDFEALVRSLEAPPPYTALPSADGGDAEISFGAVQP